jgi:nucleoside-diphosphate-sugar epimerase
MSGASVGRVLVTGAAGLLGRAVLRHLAAVPVAVTALELRDPGDLIADRVVVGDAGDSQVVRQALSDVDAVVHLAALPSPEYGSAQEVFCANTRATFAVLEQAGAARIRRIVIASSYAVIGLPWTGPVPDLRYLPLDEAHPMQMDDAYGLSKQVDEATAAMMTRRHGMTVVALRFPHLGGRERLQREADRYAADPAVGAAGLWSYLDVRDAAQACWLALTQVDQGCHTVFVAADETLAPYPTEELLAAYHGRVPRRVSFAGRSVPIDLSAGRRLFGFVAAHPFDVGAGATLPVPLIPSPRS